MQGGTFSGLTEGYPFYSFSLNLVFHSCLCPCSTRSACLCSAAARPLYLTMVTPEFLSQSLEAGNMDLSSKRIKNTMNLQLSMVILQFVPSYVPQ